MLTCPKCHAQLRTFERNGISVDQCTGCRGVFLDAGELERLIELESTWYARPAQGAPAPGHQPGQFGAQHAPYPPQPHGYAQHGHPQPGPGRRHDWDDDSDSHSHRGHGYPGDKYGRPSNKKKKSLLKEMFDF